MHRHTIPACLLSALIGAVILAPAHAGGAINRCVDGAGRVTLTDQPCDAHTVSSTVAVPGTQDVEQAPLVRSTPALLPSRWLPAGAPRIVPATAPYAALAGDMATLKQARARMLQDNASRTRLASLER